MVHHPINPDVPDWEHLPEYLSPHPSHVCNRVPLQQGLVHERPKLPQMLRQGLEGTIFFPLQSYPSSKQNHLALFPFLLLDRSPGSFPTPFMCTQ